jgi:hypothetical protein
LLFFDLKTRLQESCFLYLVIGSSLAWHHLVFTHIHSFCNTQSFTIVINELQQDSYKFDITS